MTIPSSAQEIRNAVRERYGARAREQLARTDGGRRAPSGEVIPLIDASAGGDACCAPSAPSAEQISAVRAFYQSADVAGLPATVTDAALGCGNPTAIAELRAGETVLDLGSGGGIDCFLAARQVGTSGRVIGVDMTEEMLALARANAARVGVGNVEFRRGQIEALPVEDASVDVIISNCVINLSTDKDRVLREAFRVLRPGGRFRVSDIVLTRPLSIDEERSLAEWAGCVAGALQQEDFAAKLRAAGFVEVEVRLASEWREGVHSAEITAVRPA